MESTILQSLFDDEERRPLTVSELNAEVKRTLERDFASVWVEGEIVGFSAARSGHWYFNLNDGKSQLRAACYKGSNYRIRFQPFDGLQVRVRGRITIYEPRGEYQMLVDSLEPVGEGALRVAFEQIKARLEAEGLFSLQLKRSLPAYPRRVGIVTSPTGAAFFDIVHVLSRRAKSVSVVLIPSRVQGDSASDEIAGAIHLANELNSGGDAANLIDVLIVGRGGGSAEDLWSFNDEIVARAIRASQIPVISAVGHEVDYTIADFAADVRAATPSAAAEIVARSEDELASHLEEREADLFQLVGYKLLAVVNRFQQAALSPVLTTFPMSIADRSAVVKSNAERALAAFSSSVDRRAKSLDAVSSQLTPLALASKLARGNTTLAVFEQRMAAATDAFLNRKLKSLKICMATLDALSPLAVLKRGFSITEALDGRIIRDASSLSVGDRITSRLERGRAVSEIIFTEEQS